MRKAQWFKFRPVISTVECPYCGNFFNVDGELGDGEQHMCPHCQESFILDKETKNIFKPDDGGNFEKYQKE
jgi:hypothetical protein